MSAPNPPLLPEVKASAKRAGQPDLDLASEGTQRHVWQSAFGTMLIEVRDVEALVNGARVASIAELHPAKA